eukprot:TRINITY_DN90595_c0_g1_i1.p2 TRINITY_DN90595_c0_g1~~TRINITY_DN90595_c0_g1_i1.p2  ORF type:complete len:347 (-),score=75.80 TRINITY_DN90595_c0_g1_i1:337-1353(-)
MPIARVPRSKFDVCEVIGKGQFKRVHKGRYLGRHVVVLSFEEAKSAKELDILFRLSEVKSRCVPQVFAYSRHDNYVDVIQELATCGDLKSVVQAPPSPALWTLLHRLSAAAQIASAVQFLEEQHVVHADLSCRNVLCFSLQSDAAKTVVKISDFGLSVVLQPDARDVEIDGADFAMLSDCACSETLQQPRPVRWCSPETIAFQRLSHRSDVWSLGATLWEMFAAGRDPWNGVEKRADVSARLRQLAEAARSSAAGSAAVLAAKSAWAWPLFAEDFVCPAGCPQAAYAIIQEMMTPDEFARPAAEHVASQLLSLVAAEQRLAEKAVVIDGEEWVVAGAL